jgi:hypothetical protein
VTTSPVPWLMVTSEKATVAAVQELAGMVDLWTDDGRIVRLQGAELGQLDYGYATTVHRSQGATVDRAHLFADGGGRELAYVAISRAREASRVYVVADDNAMAAEDLRRDWQIERRPVWGIDTGIPATADLTAETVAAMTQETKARAFAVAYAETAGSRNPRRDVLQQQLSVYRARLDGIEPPTPPSWPEQRQNLTPDGSVGIEL